MQFVLPKRTLPLRYLSLHRGLSELLYRHDPVGLAALGSPKDEYESEVSTIIPKLKGAAGPDDVRRIVHKEFLHWFGDEQTAGPESAYSAIACEIWEKFIKH
jgi:hypothetical protein